MPNNIDFTGIPKTPNIDFSGIPKADHTPKEVETEKLNEFKEQMQGAYKTAQEIGHVYPVAETAAHIITSLYGAPISGLAGILTTPANFIWKDANKKVVETLQDWLIYQPQTRGGEDLSGAALYPFQKLDELGNRAGGKVLEKTNNPALATAVHTAIAGAPAIVGLRHIPKGVQSVITESQAWRQMTIKERGLVVQGLEDTIRKNPSMTEGEILRRYEGLKEEAFTKRAKGESPKTDIKAMGKEVAKLEKEPNPKTLETSFEKHKNTFFQNRDEKIFRANVEARILQKDLKASLDLKRYVKSAKDVDKAIQVHIDTKRNPGHIEKYYDQLTDDQKAIVDLSQNLPEEVKPIVDRIEKSYNETGIEALDAEIIRNTLDNYASRVWDLEDKPGSEIFRKFGTKTRHAKQRVFDTVIEGWANGYNLKIEGAINNLKTYKQEIIKAIENRNLLKTMQTVKDTDGNRLITDQQLKGYKELEHPNFVSWKWAGKVEEGKAYGKNTFIDDDGNIFEKRSLYAPKKQADNLNNIFGVSKIKDVPFIPTLTKYNAISKAWILQSSLFHHLAFLRSYYLPNISPKKWSELTPRGAFRQGIEAIERLDPVLIQGVRNGLTLGVRQDWEEHLLREKTVLGKFLDKFKVLGEAKDFVLKLREMQSDWLFGEMGAALKAKTFIIEYRHALKKRPNDDPDIIAKEIAGMVNDDFGGLHLERLGRNPTLQHILRLFLLAPDWTESNVRTMVKMFPVGKDGNRYYTSKAAGKMYRKFWLGVLLKGMGITAFFNYLMAGGDTNKFVENYKKAWKAGNLKSLAIDITSIYKALGGKSPDRKYFYLIGHFKDPAKFISHPVKSLHHKGSVVYGLFHEAMVGTDWAGREFTSLETLINDKRTVEWKFGGGGPIEYDQFLSYAISELIGLQPIQIQNAISWMAGEQEGFDAISNSLGLGVTTAHQKKKKYR